VQFVSKIAETESWKFSANSASLHLCVKNQLDGNVYFHNSVRFGILFDIRPKRAGGYPTDKNAKQATNEDPNGEQSLDVSAAAPHNANPI
jgi:hypothetical protein